MERIDAVAARLAAKQHNLVTLLQLRDMGASEKDLRVRTARGQWSKAGRAVVRINGAPLTWESRVLAAVLDGGRGAVASHQTAAVLWGFEGFSSAGIYVRTVGGGRCFKKGVVEITVPRGRRVRCPGVVAQQSGDLDRTTPTVLHGIPTTLATRTLLDLGAVVPPEKVHVALDYARRKKLTNWNVLLDTLVVHARRGRDGVGTLRAILDSHFGEIAQTESGFERLVLVALAEAGLPEPVLQHEVRIGARRYRLDLAYPRLKVAIELDGSDHLRQDVWEADHIRQNALVNAGWTVLRFTWRDYIDRRLVLIADIRSALSVRN